MRPNPSHAGPPLVLGALLCVLLWSVPPAAAQPTPEATERENELVRLREEVVRLRERTDSLVRLLDEQAREIERLRSQLAAVRSAPASPDAGGPAGETSAGNDAPLSSPGALFRAMVRSYVARFGAPPVPPDVRELDEWRDATRQELSGRTRWLVRLTLGDAPQRRSEGWPATVEVLDPATLGAVEATIALEIPSRLAPRVQEASAAVLDGQERVPVFAAELELLADPQLNPDRSERGPFDYPPLVGPGIEFDYGLRWQTLYQIDQAKLDELRRDMAKDAATPRQPR